VGRQFVILYWSIGSDILARRGTESWGTRVIDRLSHDLHGECSAWFSLFELHQARLSLDGVH
jgi:hypothetical protein